MKPDKHKAKRSSAYKKRQNNKESKNKDPKKVESKPQAHSDDGIEVTSFKKRTLVSNWDKYDKQFEDEVIGEPYEVVLASASHASSNLILEIEKEWEHYKDFDQMYAIDCNEISSVMQKIGFCERFDLKRQEIDATLLKVLDEEKKVEFTEQISDISFDQNIMFNYSKIDFIKPIKTSEATEAHPKLLKDVNKVETNTEKVSSESKIQTNCEADIIMELKESKEDSKGDKNETVDVDTKITSIELDETISKSINIKKDINDETDVDQFFNDLDYAKEDNQAEAENLEDWLDSII